MPSIDPHIIEHEIKTYPNAKSIQQRLSAVNSRKAPTIKDEIEKTVKCQFYLSYSLDGVGFKPRSGW